MAGFKSPLFLLGLGSTGQKAGFRGPLPIPPFGARSEQQAGYATPLPIYFGWSGAELPEPPVEAIRRKGGGGRLYHDDDEAILAVIMAAALRRDGGPLH